MVFGDLFHQLPELVALSRTHVEEADADRKPVMKRLDHAAQAEREPVSLEFRLHAPVDSDGKALVGPDAAPAHAHVQNSP